MNFTLRIILPLLFVIGTLSQELDLSDALGDLEPTPAKPKEQPKPADPNPKPAADPPKSGGDDFGFDLSDALQPDPKPKPDKPAVDPPKSGGGGLDLEDALGPDLNPKPDKPAVNPPKSGGGGGRNFGDSDLLDVSDGDYKPDGGRSQDPGYNPQGGADQPQEAGGGLLAGIISSVGVALVGAASSYFAYQKKKLCFKIQGGVDPESGKDHTGQSDPQVFSNLLRTS